LDTLIISFWAFCKGFSTFHTLIPFLAFCSGADCDSDGTPTTTAFCGGAQILFAPHDYFPVFNSGVYNTPITTAFCGGAQTISALHGYFLAFCRGASIWRDTLNNFFRDFCGGSSDCDTPDQYQLPASGSAHLGENNTPTTTAFCGGAHLHLVLHGVFTAFCRGAYLRKDAPNFYFQDFCGGSSVCETQDQFSLDNSGSTDLVACHTPTTTAFCGGAQSHSASTLDLFSRTFSGGFNDCDKLYNHHLALGDSTAFDARDTLTPIAFCGGAQQRTDFVTVSPLDSVALSGGAQFLYNIFQHGQSVAFCRGVIPVFGFSVLQLALFTGSSLLLELTIFAFVW